MTNSVLFALGQMFAAIQPRQAVTGTVTIAPTQAVTGTVTVAAAPTRESVLTSVAPSSAVPPGTPGVNPFTTDYMFAPANPAIGIFSGLFAILCLALLGVGAYFYFVGNRRWRVHKLHRKIAQFWSAVVMGLGGVGVLFTLFRQFNIEGLNDHFWFYLLLLVMIGFGIYAASYFRMLYPKELADYLSKQPRKAGGARAGAVATPKATPPRTARPATPTTPSPTARPERPPGTPGNPRGTSTRGERRREKK
jgi:hypothetical protein